MASLKGRSAGDQTPLLRRLGANLRAYREEVGATREEIAAGAGVGVELLAELEEAGGTIPATGLALRLAGSLRRRPSELVAGVRWVPIEVVEGEGRFVVLTDDGLREEIAALREAWQKRPTR